MIGPAMPEGYRRFGARLVLALACAASLPMPPFAGAARGTATDPAAIGEARVLAERILRRQSDRLLFEEAPRNALIREIGQVLARVRECYPALATIRVRHRRSPVTLLLGVETGLFDAIARGRDESGVSGNGAFDALNAKLGVRKIRLFPSLRMVALETGPRVNVDAAMKAYLAMDGVISAEPDARPGDGPDIGAAMSGGLWHVVLRQAWGDCPSGCMNAELFFFTVDGGDVRPVEPRGARGMAAFSALLARRGWGRGWD